MTENRTLIKGADWLLTMDPDLGDIPGGDVLIEGSKIVAIGPDLGVVDANIIDGTGRFVIPGFVDTHRHLWQTQMRNIAADWTLSQYLVGLLGTLAPVYRPEDVYAGNLLGVLEALDTGITTILDWSHCAILTPEHADAAVSALTESRSRAVYAHGNGAPIWIDRDLTADWSDLARLQGGATGGLVTLAAAVRGPDFGSLDVAVKDWHAARDLGVPITVHIGVAGYSHRPVAQLHDKGLLGPDTTYVHCSRLDDDELKMIADTGGTVSIATEVEMHMGHGYPPTGRLLAAGVRPSLSIDVCTGIGGDMFGAMRTTLSMQRAIDNDLIIRSGIRPAHLEVTARDILAFATVEGARTLGLGSRIGTLTPGKDADVVLLRADTLNMFPVNNPVASVALAATTANVETVLVAGRVVKRDGKLVDVDIKRVRQLAEDSRDYLLRQTPGACLGGAWQPSATW
ncbi:MAG: amidohydrolase [Frankiales bacterium]|nr:amidohydrolase [Frankiales bacterium]